MSSNIRVFVQWKHSTVFAGEDIECTITFKNIALPNGRDRSPIRNANGFAAGGERQRKLPPVHSSTRPSVSRNSSYASQGPLQHLRGHRPTLSLHTASSTAERRSPVPPSGAFNNGSAIPAQKSGHGRSLSIMSIGTDATEASLDQTAPSRRPTRGHGRSASLQVMPGRVAPFSGSGSSSDSPDLADVFQLPHQATERPPTTHHCSVELPPRPSYTNPQTSFPCLPDLLDEHQACPRRLIPLPLVRRPERHRAHSHKTSSFLLPRRRKARLPTS